MSDDDRLVTLIVGMFLGAVVTAGWIWVAVVVL